MLKELIEMGKIKKKADLLLANANLVNVFSGEIYSTNIALGENLIVGVGSEYTSAKEIFNLHGKYVLPGFIDGHVHIESSLLTIPEFARAVLPRGTTTVVIDPHEIANVLGIAGIKYMLDSSEGVPLSVFVMASSCVPTTDMETAGAKLTAKDLRKLLTWKKVLGLGELMNYPGVIYELPDVLKKILAAKESGKIIDGHAPGLTGSQLEAYLDAGIGSDHECTSAEEAREKLRLGMRIMIREGSAAKNLKDLLPIVDDTDSRRCVFVSDDRHPGDLIKEGHIDHILRKSVALGFDPVKAIQMVTLNPAEYFGLHRLGAVAPGYIADLVVVDNLTQFNPSMVFKKGKMVAEKGKMVEDIPSFEDKLVRNTIKLRSVRKENLQITVKAANDKVKVRVIGIIPSQIITKHLVKSVRPERGFIISDTKKDILKMAVVERHHATGNMGLGLVHGFELKEGALASSFTHDSHNIIVVGTRDEDMLVAIKEIQKIGGGYVACKEGKVAAALSLPIAGLMSDQPVEQVENDLRNLITASRNLGTKLPNPFITLSFLALAVIPELKLTDKGLVDVAKFKIVPLSAEE